MSRIGHTTFTPPARARMMPSSNATTPGGTMPSYSDVQKAANVEKRRVWFAWLAGSLLMLFVAQAINVLAGAPTVAAVVFAVVFVLLTVTAYRMHQALNRRADGERREVLGDDYPG